MKTLVVQAAKIASTAAKGDNSKPAACPSGKLPVTDLVGADLLAPLNPVLVNLNSFSQWCIFTSIIKHIVASEIGCALLANVQLTIWPYVCSCARSRSVRSSRRCSTTPSPNMLTTILSWHYCSSRRFLYIHACRVPCALSQSRYSPVQRCIGFTSEIYYLAKTNTYYTHAIV